jgi:uncharacterized protein
VNLLAQKILMDSGYIVYPISPKGGKIYDVPVLTNLKAIDKTIDTITIYINANKLEGYVADIIKLAPRRVIFNLGTESLKFAKRLEMAGIQILEGSTLVMLRTGQF